MMQLGTGIHMTIHCNCTRQFLVFADLPASKPVLSLQLSGVNEGNSKG